MPVEGIGARISNDSIVLEGVVPDAVAADRAVQIAESYAPGKVINLLSIGSSQQVMLEVRFSEIKRSALKNLGVSWFFGSDGGKLGGVVGGGASINPIIDKETGEILGSQKTIEAVTGSYGIVSRAFRALGTNFEVQLDALERKGAVTTLAEPTLVALSGETASFLAGGEFPVPVIQNSGGGGAGGASNAITVEWKPFGVSLAFTPTVLADGVINMVVAPEVSSIDSSAAIVISGLTIPGIQTRRAKTTIELRDGESFALAGLLRRDFQDTVRQIPLLGSIPIIGSLFRSSGFNKEETELVMIVTPRLVRPVRAGTLKTPSDRVKPPNEADLFLGGRTDTGVPVAPEFNPPPFGQPLSSTPSATPGGSAQRKPTGFEKEYGHVL
jgi:pilus assembly protein CpaC